LRVDIRIGRLPAIRRRRRTRWHHPREPDEPAHRAHAEKQTKGGGPYFIELESQAEGAGRQSGLHGHLGNAWLIVANSRTTELALGDLRPDFPAKADTEEHKQWS
jgi:hypothetical protein